MSGRSCVTGQAGSEGTARSKWTGLCHQATRTPRKAVCFLQCTWKVGDRDGDRQSVGSRAAQDRSVTRVQTGR